MKDDFTLHVLKLFWWTVTIQGELVLVPDTSGIMPGIGIDFGAATTLAQL